MTIADQILYAAKMLYFKGHQNFSRKDIREYLAINCDKWNSSFNPIFQGMRIDQPGKAPNVSLRCKNTLRQVDHGVYTLSDKGLSIIAAISDKGHGDVVSAIKPMMRIFCSKNTFTPSIHKTDSKEKNYENNIISMLNNLEYYHDSFYKNESFGAPCLFFHLKAINTVDAPFSKEHLEYVYATLIAWGMHRTGNKGSKMRSFDEFKSSFESLRNEITDAKFYKFSNLGPKEWSTIEKIFKNVRVMKSGTSLVGNSKAMHHFLPNLIPPIDRTYTLSFLQGNTNIQNNIDSEWNLMKDLINNFFIPIAKNNVFDNKAKEWFAQKETYLWDTSEYKVIDNLIVGAMNISN